MSEKYDIDNIYTYHAPDLDQTKRYEIFRAMAKDLARKIMMSTPPSRERSLALTKLEEVIFWANASIARNKPLSTIAPEQSNA
jgi:hypothetical protein